MSKFKHTLTYSFLFPLLCDKEQLLNNSFISNCFLADLLLPKFKYVFNKGIIDNQHLTVINVNDKSNIKYSNFENEIIKSPYYVQGYPVLNSDLQLLQAKIFKFPQEYKNDYYHFLHGNYSKFSQQAKDVIIKYHGCTITKQYVKQTLTKDIKLKELWLTLDEIDIPKENEYWYKPSLKYKHDNPYPTGEMLNEDIKQQLKKDYEYSFKIKP